MAYQKLLRPLLFRLQPETAHNLALWAIAKGLVRARLVRDPRLQTSLWGVNFPNPLGLAAGFDKNGIALSRWAGLGFGFAEVGTVTPLGQPGNPRPRMFRLPHESGIINRLGFNNAGAVALAARFKACPKQAIPIGINLGKNKITPEVDAAADYQKAFKDLHTYGDYFVVNVSSPNTPGLRSLQSVAALREIIEAMQEVDSSRPILVKIAPDLADQDLTEIGRLASEMKLAGLIATNTTIRRDLLARDPEIVGGLSGKPLRALSTEVLAKLRADCDCGLKLIGVGGVFSADDLITKMRAGANLVQIYTGWVYGGPMLVPRLLLDLLDHPDWDEVRALRA